LPGFTARREYTNLILQKPTQNSQAGYSHNLILDTPVNIDSISVTLSLQEPSKNQSYCTQAFNYDKVHALQVRTRRPGDKITLVGGTKKLQDYFTDTKTPKSQRDSIPLVADGSNILWILPHNRISTAYVPESGKQTCWITINIKHTKEGKM